MPAERPGCGSRRWRHCDDALLYCSSPAESRTAVLVTFAYERSGGSSKVSVQELEPCPTQALAFGVSDEGSERPAVGQAAGTDVQFTVT